MVIKDDSISRFANNPTSRNKNFSEDVTVEVCSCLDDHVQGLKVEVPVNIDRIPAIGAERALEKKMKACFLRAILAKNTAVVIKIHILPSQDVSGAEPILNQ